MCKFDHSICVGLGKFWPQFALFTERFMHSTKILRERQSHRSQQISWLNTFKERKHDLNNKKTTTKTNTKAMTNAFREHLQCAIFETCDLWDICSDKTWLTNKKTNTQTKTNTFREQLQRAIFDTWDLLAIKDTCDICDNLEITDNLEPQNITIMTMKSDTGQQLQFLGCLYIKRHKPQKIPNPKNMTVIIIWSFTPTHLMKVNEGSTVMVKPITIV